MRVQLIGTAEGRSIDVREDDGEVTEKAKAKEGGSALMDMANLWTGGFEVLISCPDHCQMFDDSSEC